MAKISRKKKGKAPGSSRSVAAKFDVQKFLRGRREHDDGAFELAFQRLKTLLTAHAARDALVALNVLDLWPANVSAQVKSQLAFAAYLSIAQDEFASAKLDSYDQFSQFCRSLMEVLPSFPMLEDYWPESDWGVVRWTDGINSRPTFYGGTVQRIPDFIQAFQILHGDSSEAMNDLRCARQMQSTVLEAVPAPDSHAPVDAASGHIEVPPEWFWTAVQEVLLTQQAPVVTADLLASPGIEPKWKTASGFGDAVMSGEVVPWLGVNVGGTFLPISLRNAPATVIDFWSDRRKVDGAAAAVRLTAFIGQRVQPRSFLAGPLQVINRRGPAARMLAAVLPGDDKHYLVVLSSVDELRHIDMAVAEMKRKVRESPDWAFIRPGSRDGLQLRSRNGREPSEDSLEVIVVVGTVTTRMVRMSVPQRRDCHTVSIVDAVTIFDAMEDLDELTRFWKYRTGLRRLVGGMPDVVDMFGAFRDSHGQIVAGAIVPNMIMLDPHWGESWRFNQLVQYWEEAPANFPDDRSAWNTKDSRGRTTLRRVTARNAPRLAWSSQLANSTVHVVLDVDLVDLQSQDGNVLETFVHCAADCFAEREAELQSIGTLPYSRIVIECVAQADALASLAEEEIETAADRELLLSWRVIENQASDEVRIRCVINLSRVFARLRVVEDASFEVECAVALMDVLLTHAHGRRLSESERQVLADTGSRSPRFVMRSYERTVDVPDFGRPDTPAPEAYKVARRKLAEILMAQGVKPGRYELGEAKQLINAARATYRELVHERLRSFDRESLLRYCATQLDTTSAQYDSQVMRHRNSLAHDVDYDREDSQAEAHEQFTRDSRNLRYAVEAGLFLTQPQPTEARPAEILEVLGMIDWLLVLYGASDVLHNEIEVGGLDVDDQYIPEVFFSSARDAQQAKFSREMAALKLGAGVNTEDKLEEPFEDEKFIESLDAAFLIDLGFTYRDLLKVFSTLQNWIGIGAGAALAFSYEALPSDIARAAVGSHDDLAESAALKAIDFLVLKSDGIRRLAGITAETDDVPVWEHNKRLDRFAIKPLLVLPTGKILWGASSVNRARRIWMSAISSGYLPADFPWKNVRAVVDKAKQKLEKGLEKTAHAVCARTTPYAERNLDFMDRFPEQGFADVGDFDLLAYWPEGNRWLLGECKYNQPPFCVKDSRRLRDRVFGGGSEIGQFVKIERRRKFFAENVELIRQLLGWPEPTTPEPTITEVYICKDLHWWLRFPPYDVPTKFTQVDTFGAWLSANGFVNIREPGPA
ncbi:hypothetical protein [Variovorax guangxiensis]|uniref:Uncharacterized protein n=1 Tax=Variovorax guangxiensis TaxID=1775474 RepID=A0A840FZV4_9BURK|nr:hypothetical protein [Variovorax guangxiensis]MBB4224899.1 hypothetical protein [Variovorax guangxiensis]